MKKPRILVTNDDGITAGGIKALIEVVSQYGEVIVVAPDSPQSAQGHAITIAQPIFLNQVDLYDGIEAYQCSGTPVDCVKLAQTIVCKDRPISLCVSGINHGSNAAINILYSGTMSAAMEAAIEDVNAIGFSYLDFKHDADFTACKPFVEHITKHVLANGLDNCNLLNVNIPVLPANEIKGIKVCRQANARWKEAYEERVDPRGRKYFWLTGEFLNNDDGEDSDVYALEKGYVSVVPSGFDLTIYDALDPLKVIEDFS